MILAAGSAPQHGNDDADLPTRGRIVATAKQKPNGQKSLPLKPERTKKLDVSALESWLWEAACTIRGPLDAPKFKDYILPLIFLKRLSDVFDDEIAPPGRRLRRREDGPKLVEQDHKLVRFYIPQKARWAHRGEDDRPGRIPDRRGARRRPREPAASGVIDVTDFNATAAGQRIVDDDRLAALVQVLNNPDHRLGLDDVEPDILGRAYEYLLRKFAEGQGQSAGEFYTPREVAVLMAHHPRPPAGHDRLRPVLRLGGPAHQVPPAAAGNQGEEEQRAADACRTKSPPLQLFGQEINPSTFAMARMNAFIHDMEAEIALGDTMHRPALHRGRRSAAPVRPGDRQSRCGTRSSPPATYENDTYDRFKRGIPPASTRRLGLGAAHGRLAQRHRPHGRGARHRRRQPGQRQPGLEQGARHPQGVRRGRSDRGRPAAAGEPVLQHHRAGHHPRANRTKRHPGEILLINASKLFSQGPAQELPRRQHVDQIGQVYHEWQAVDGLSAIITKAEAVEERLQPLAQPVRFHRRGRGGVAAGGSRGALAGSRGGAVEADRELDAVLAKLGFEGWRNG